ncbi:hypothetical protein SYNTR_0909 [Candidatus Syntrophocurvum alkaliphilum]|uniref:Uncharacterized protein n=1 Tax=Candidatus Syntrophocurvum alkaliphilum TaxID=2293317 RepID=A0A6I6DES4_9FIRM|nr:hypothetical protein [Candidatus Syntrophocurvum alkaliphilum]QGT99502.1 hypothetical protein SYNTR_0909 [Candidatus Syntrophocurvum alkaliphilum]
MSINKTILTALSNLEVPVTFQTYKGKANTYITFFTYLDKAEQHADDEERITGQYIQLDIWSNSDYTDLVDNVHNLMQQAGFIKISFNDLYENDLKIYHKVMRYRIEKEE